MVIASAAALVVLLVLTVPSVYKPRGMALYGQRKQDEQRQRIVQECEDSDAQAIPVILRKGSSPAASDTPA